VYTVCLLPATVPFLCENITKNNIRCDTSIPMDHWYKATQIDLTRGKCAKSTKEHDIVLRHNQSKSLSLLCASGEWKLYWKQRVVDSPDFDVMGCWHVATDNICGQYFVIFHNCAALFACDLAQGWPHSVQDQMLNLQPPELSLFPDSAKIFHQFGRGGGVKRRQLMTSERYLAAVLRRAAVHMLS
jgi:hypothetical protein